MMRKNVFGMIAAALCAAGASFAARAGTMEEGRALDFAGVRRLGVTAGASTPEEFLARVIADLGMLAS